MPIGRSCQAAVPIEPVAPSLPVELNVEKKRATTCNARPASKISLFDTRPESKKPNSAKNTQD